MSTLSDLVARLHALVDDAGEVETAALLSGGYSNRNYRLGTDRGDFVLRVGSPHAGHMGVNRERELSALERATSAGLMLPVIAFDVDSGDMLTRYQHIPTAADAVSDASTLHAAAGLLRRTHALAPTAHDADPRHAIDRYVHVARNAGFKWPAVIDALRARLEDAPFQATGFMHGDPNPWNVLCAGERAWLLDWEMAGRGDPAFDLTVVAVLWTELRAQTAEQIATEQDRWFEAYGASPAMRVRSMQLEWLFRMREVTWAGAMLALGQRRPEINDQYTSQLEWLTAWMKH